MWALLQENRKTLVLAAPIVAGQVSQMLLGLADTVMIGQVGTEELAAAAFVNTLFHMGFVLAIGLFVAAWCARWRTSRSGTWWRFIDAFAVFG
jgi:MATE family multidrug resistance protein